MLFYNFFIISQNNYEKTSKIMVEKMKAVLAYPTFLTNKTCSLKVNAPVRALPNTSVALLERVGWRLKNEIHQHCDGTPLVNGLPLFLAISPANINVSCFDLP